MGISRVFRKNRSATMVQPQRDLVISEPVSVSHDGGLSMPPWMNSYAGIQTVRVENYIHPARDDFYDKRGFQALQTFGSTTWVHARDNESVRSASTDDSVPIEELRDEQPERRGLRQRLFRNRGRNADGSLRDDYDDYSMPEWGIEDEGANKRRHRCW